MIKFPHKVTVWTRDGVDPMGTPIYSRVGVLDARWESRDSVVITNDGRQERSDTTVYFKQYVDRGSFVLFGENSDPSPPQEAREARSSRWITNYSGKETEYRVQL